MSKPAKTLPRSFSGGFGPEQGVEGHGTCGGANAIGEQGARGGDEAGHGGEHCVDGCPQNEGSEDVDRATRVVGQSGQQ
ncbi:hypothetical protein LP422_20790 [Janibacter limosus]|uniref:Uncharacterized protein n=1 Tax=Janibacter limosus TaxID=53458 RepID=A0AC61U3Y9_9MICO|nr:hypothetical protein [Janibacter limosus]UUZ44711.1 hypothetical protein LP422_20790 [Janibacter limosus]